MGLFDWLFGKKKKDPYGAGFRQDYGTEHPSDDQYQARRRSADPSNPTRNRARKMGFRRARSKTPPDPVPDQNLGGMNPQTGRVSGGPLPHLGGTRQSPDPNTDIAALRSCGLPEISSLDDLAELIGVGRHNIVFLVVRPNLTEPTHYTLRELPKKSGGSRILAVPMPQLKAAQKALNEKLVSRLPVHHCSHGFRKGRDVLSGASPHVGKDVVVSIDIEDFFPSFTFRRVAGYFRSLGYGRGTATALANLTTFRLADASIKKNGRWTWASVHYHPDLEKRWHPELPQGAPTSPGIANAIARRMDKRLHALALKFGADYTRYADDLTFSGGTELANGAGRLLMLARKIVRTEGLSINEKKTRIMRKGRQQRVTGVVVNQQTNVSRRDFDRLKAILHNCIKHGPAGQNREGVPDFKEHLRGRIAHFSHIGPERGRKLKAMFDQIRW